MESRVHCVNHQCDFAGDRARWREGPELRSSSAPLSSAVVLVLHRWLGGGEEAEVALQVGIAGEIGLSGGRRLITAGILDPTAGSVMAMLCSRRCVHRFFIAPQPSMAAPR